MTFRNMIAIAAILGFGFGGLATLAHAQAPANAAEIVKARQAGYKRIANDAKVIKAGIESGANLTALAPDAQAIADWAAKIPTMFPPGTGTDNQAGIKTHALPAIWENEADFHKLAANLGAAADKLTTALKANDAAASKAAFGATGAACGACHRAYRQKI